MKFRLDFVTNSSSSSYLSISVHSREFVELISKINGPWRNNAPNIDNKASSFSFIVEDVNRDDLYSGVPIIASFFPIALIHWIDELCVPIDEEMLPQLVSSVEAADCAEMILSIQYEEEPSAQWFKGTKNGSMYFYDESSQPLDSTFHEMIHVNACESNLLSIAIQSSDLVDFIMKIDRGSYKANIECTNRSNMSFFMFENCNWAIVERTLRPVFSSYLQVSGVLNFICTLIDSMFLTLTKEQRLRLHSILKSVDCLELLTEFYSKQDFPPTEFKRIWIQDGSYKAEYNELTPYSPSLRSNTICNDQNGSSSLDLVRNISEFPASITLTGCVIAAYCCMNERKIREVVEYYECDFDDSFEKDIDIVIIGSELSNLGAAEEYLSKIKLSEKAIGLTEDEFWILCRKMAEKLPVKIDEVQRRILRQWEYELNYVYDNSVTLTAYKGNEKNVIVPPLIDGYRVTGLKSVFKDNQTIETIILPDSLTYIFEDAFSNCQHLVELLLPSSLRFIGDSAFSNCRALKSIVVPSRVSKIGRFAFSNCYNLEELILPPGLTDIHPGMFCGLSAGSKMLPNEKFLIFNGLLAGYRGNDETVDIPYGVRIIGEEAISRIYTAKNITIPDTVHTIGQHAVNNCTSVVRISLSQQLKKIRSFSFYGLTKLQRISIPSSIDELDTPVFIDADDLREIVFEEGFLKFNFALKKLCNKFSKVSRIVLPASITELATEELPAKKSLKYVVVEGSPAERILLQNGFQIEHANQ